MNEIFADMFSIPPHEIVEGDYFFPTPWHDFMLSFIPPEFHKGGSIEAYREWREKSIKNGFKKNWERRTLGNPSYLEFWTWLKSIKLKETMEKIAFGNIPFMDIASSGDGLGLAAYIIKMNPQIPCLITDLSAHEMKVVRPLINEYLPEYNISIAAFDNCEMPIKDNSLDCITSIHGITSSNGKLPEGIESLPYPYPFPMHKEKPISEVYRVLKSGGCFVTIEQDWKFDYDLQNIYDNYNDLLTYDEIDTACKFLNNVTWRDKFMEAGFQIEVEEKYYRKEPDYCLNLLYNVISQNKIRELTDEDKNKFEYKKDIGFDKYHLNAFYVLRKGNDNE